MTTAEIMSSLQAMLTRNRKFYLSSKRMTVQVNTDSQGRIVWGAPIIWRFMGQPLGNLIRWMQADVINDLGEVRETRRQSSGI